MTKLRGDVSSRECEYSRKFHQTKKEELEMLSGQRNEKWRGGEEINTK